MRKSVNYLSLIILGGLLFSCSLPTEPGPQPSSLIDTESESGLVVFGVFRPDAGMSFIEVGGSFSLETGGDQANAPWSKPDVVVVDSISGEIFYFETDPRDTANTHFYLDEFIAQVGHTYQVTVAAPDYEPLTGSTTVPVSPEIEAYLLGDIEFTLTVNAQPDIQSYEIHLSMSDGSSTIKNITSNGDAKLIVDFTWSDLSLEATQFVVYGYERNLSEYLGTTVSIKPQSYQPQEYYVEGGFGVIGALNFTEPINLGD
ncbi:MAG: DUF4249 family protein [Candidatus Marinimicrobia bacterium]|nr:DUF4249 family protein [Candidatus Neomarinimicrobiota bacterium]